MIFVPCGEALRVARPFQFVGVHEWHAWCRTGARHAKLPSRPDHVYGHNRWMGWKHWLRRGNARRQYTGRGRSAGATTRAARTPAGPGVVATPCGCFGECGGRAHAPDRNKRQHACPTPQAEADMSTLMQPRSLGLHLTLYNTRLTWPAPDSPGSRVVPATAKHGACVHDHGKSDHWPVPSRTPPR